MNYNIRIIDREDYFYELIEMKSRRSQTFSFNALILFDFKQNLKQSANTHLIAMH